MKTDCPSYPNQTIIFLWCNLFHQTRLWGLTCGNITVRCGLEEMSIDRQWNLQRLQVATPPLGLLLISQQLICRTLMHFQVSKRKKPDECEQGWPHCAYKLTDYFLNMSAVKIVPTPSINRHVEDRQSQKITHLSIINNTRSTTVVVCSSLNKS